MATGTVKWFNDQKGFGFIKQDDLNEDIFVHHTAIKMEGFRTLAPGEPVDYELKQDDKGFKAINVMRSEQAPEAGNTEAVAETAPQAEVIAETAPQAEVIAEAAPQAEVIAEAAPQAEVIAEAAPQAEVVAEAAPQAEVIAEAAPQAEVVAEEAIESAPEQA